MTALAGFQINVQIIYLHGKQKVSSVKLSLFIKNRVELETWKYGGDRILHVVGLELIVFVSGQIYSNCFWVRVGFIL